MKNNYHFRIQILNGGSLPPLAELPKSDKVFFVGESITIKDKLYEIKKTVIYDDKRENFRQELTSLDGIEHYGQLYMNTWRERYLIKVKMVFDDSIEKDPLEMDIPVMPSPYENYIKLDDRYYECLNISIGDESQKPSILLGLAHADFTRLPKN